MMDLEDQNYSHVVEKLRKSFKSGKMKSLERRLHELQQLHLMLEESEEEIYEALYNDLHKCKVEANLTEVVQLRIEIGTAIQKLKSWMKSESVKSDYINMLNTCEIWSEPLGVVLIIGAWNYPINLIFIPLVGALAAGNCVILKPSEVATFSGKVIEKLVTKYMNQDCVKVVNGGIPETTALLKQRFDHIFYTGGGFVGKIILRAAAEFLTPVTLELGGKSPAIVDNTCNYDVAAQRIIWAKLTNAGQTCISIDYIICVGNCQDKLIKSLKDAVRKFFGEDPKVSKSYGRIINKRHFQRVCKLIDKSKVVFGNVVDEDDLYISPTILKDVTPEDLVMQEEIFGPILPIITVETVEDAVDFVNDREKPLALYIFSQDNMKIQSISEETSSGGVCINDAMVQAGVPNLPFGGVGHSGMGAYHGKASFDCFSHKKSLLWKSQMLEGINSIRYPPYDENNKLLQFTEWLLKPTVKKL